MKVSGCGSFGKPHFPRRTMNPEPKPLGGRDVSPGSDRTASHKKDGSDVRRPLTSLPATARRSALAVVLTLSACARAPGDPSSGALADTLAQRIEDAYDFTRPDVVERMSALYPDSGRVISASGGFVTTTVDSLKQGLADFWANVGVNMSDPRWEWGVMHVDRLSEDAAVMTATWSIPHMAPTGRPHTISGAWTAVFRRLDGEWKIIQEHLSVPPEGQ